MTDVRLTALNPDDSQVYPVACNASGELRTVDQKIEVIDNDVTINGSLSVDSGNLFSVNKSGDTAFEFIVGNTFSGNQPVYIAADYRFEFSGDTPSRVYGLAVSPGTQGFSSQDEISSYVATAGPQHNMSSSKVISGFKSHVTNGANLGSGTEYAFYASSNSPSFFGGEVIVTSRNKRWTLVEQGGLCHLVELATEFVDEEASDLPEKEYPKLRDVFNELNMIEGALEEIMSRLKMVPPTGWEVWDGSNETA
jgi:hypothetical protein